MCELLLVANGPSRNHIYGKQSIDGPARLAHSLVLTRTMGALSVLWGAEDSQDSLQFH